MSRPTLIDLSCFVKAKNVPAETVYKVFDETQKKVVYLMNHMTEYMKFRARNQEAYARSLSKGMKSFKSSSSEDIPCFLNYWKRFDDNLNSISELILGSSVRIKNEIASNFQLETKGFEEEYKTLETKFQNLINSRNSSHSELQKANREYESKFVTFSTHFGIDLKVGKSEHEKLCRMQDNLNEAAASLKQLTDKYNVSMNELSNYIPLYAKEMQLLHLKMIERLNITTARFIDECNAVDTKIQMSVLRLSDFKTLDSITFCNELLPRLEIPSSSSKDPSLSSSSSFYKCVDTRFNGLTYVALVDRDCAPESIVVNPNVPAKKNFFSLMKNLNKDMTILNSNSRRKTSYTEPKKPEIPFAAKLSLDESKLDYIDSSVISSASKDRDIFYSIHQLDEQTESPLTDAQEGEGDVSKNDDLKAE